MFKLSIRTKKLALTMVSGAILLQTAGCDIFNILQTTFLGVIAGTTLWLARAA